MYKTSLHDEKTFYPQFLVDLEASKNEVVIESPFITIARMKTFWSIFRRMVDCGVKIYIVTRDPREHIDGYDEQSEVEIQEFEVIGIQVTTLGLTLFCKVICGVLQCGHMNKIIFISLSLIAVVGIGFFALNKQNTQSSGITKSEPQASPTEVTERKTTTDTSSWTVYTNKTFGYSLKFPTTYQVVPQTAKHISQVGLDNNTVIEKKSDTNGTEVIIIDVSVDKENLSLKDFMNNNLKMYSITGPLIDYNLNGYDSIFNKNQPGMNVFVKNSNNIYHITASTASSNTEVADIISTFKFTK